MHGGAYEFRAGQPYNKEVAEKENMPALEKGGENLKVHIENMLKFGVPVVVTINTFTADTDKEIKFLIKYAKDCGAMDAVPIEAWSKGGDGCIEAAEAVIKACDQPNKFKLLYPDDMPIKEKIESRWSGLHSPCRAEDSALHRSGLGKSLPQHGQDPPLPFP
jgi:formyltetrahydrofolate synthetase